MALDKIQSVYIDIFYNISVENSSLLIFYQIRCYAASYKTAGFHSSAILSLYTISKSVLGGLQ